MSPICQISYYSICKKQCNIFTKRSWKIPTKMSPPATCIPFLHVKTRYNRCVFVNIDEKN